MSTRTCLRIGTRGSQLALWQANTVANRLREAHGAEGVDCEIVTIKTSGDRLGEAPLSEAGGKRLFVREIEEALLDRRVDIAVHSAKDMPVDAVDGLTIAGVLPREEPWDAIVLPARSPLATRGDAGTPTGEPARTSAQRRVLDAGQSDRKSATPAASDRQTGGSFLTPPSAAFQHLLSALGPACTVGTSSVRRVAQLQRVMPGATFAPIRGNLDTRLRKLDEGQYDVLVLATAGLKRLGAGGRISARVPLTACIPAPGQGIVAVQVRADDGRARARVAAIGDEAAAQALAAEQAVVAALGGGCQMPIGAIALHDGDGGLELHAIVLSLDGERALRALFFGPAADAAGLGGRAGADLLSQGAAELLGDVERVDNS